MHGIISAIIGIVLCLTVMVSPAAGRHEPELTGHVSSAKEILDAMRPLPPGAEISIDHLFAFAATPPRLAFNPAREVALVNFVAKACGEDSGWKPASRAGAEGAAYVVTIDAPLSRYLQLNFNPGIPDYAVFPASLRYSTCADSNAMSCVYSAINTGPTGALQVVTGRVTGREEITPNPESGSYFSYTTSRVFIRGAVGGRDVLFSCAETTGPSTLSNRGVLVGPLDQALFYYSEKPGLNLSGMTWMTSQIMHSTTLSVYIALTSNTTAVASFAWLNAGWKGLNVTRSKHILNSQKTTLDFSRKIAQDQRITPEGLTTLVSTVAAMPDSRVNGDYGKYLGYVKAERERCKSGLFAPSSLLEDLYDEKASESIAQPYRRALVIQERVRGLLGIPTWSKK